MSQSSSQTDSDSPPSYLLPSFSFGMAGAISALVTSSLIFTLSKNSFYEVKFQGVFSPLYLLTFGLIFLGGFFCGRAVGGIAKFVVRQPTSVIVQNPFLILYFISVAIGVIIGFAFS